MWVWVIFSQLMPVDQKRIKGSIGSFTGELVKVNLVGWSHGDKTVLGVGEPLVVPETTNL